MVDKIIQKVKLCSKYILFGSFRFVCIENFLLDSLFKVFKNLFPIKRKIKKRLRRLYKKVLGFLGRIKYKARIKTSLTIYKFGIKRRKTFKRIDSIV